MPRALHLRLLTVYVIVMTLAMLSLQLQYTSSSRLALWTDTVCARALATLRETLCVAFLV